MHELIHISVTLFLHLDMFIDFVDVREGNFKMGYYRCVKKDLLAPFKWPNHNIMYIHSSVAQTLLSF